MKILLQKPWLPLLLLIAVMVVSMPDFAQACPTCKDGISENQGGIVRGYQLSIIFMMTMPFLILGALCTYFYLEIRRARNRQAIAQLAEAAEPHAT